MLPLVRLNFLRMVGDEGQAACGSIERGSLCAAV